MTPAESRAERLKKQYAAAAKSRAQADTPPGVSEDAPVGTRNPEQTPTGPDVPADTRPAVQEPASVPGNAPEGQGTQAGGQPTGSPPTPADARADTQSVGQPPTQATVPASGGRPGGATGQTPVYPDPHPAQQSPGGVPTYPGTPTSGYPGYPPTGYATGDAATLSPDLAGFRADARPRAYPPASQPVNPGIRVETWRRLVEAENLKYAAAYAKLIERGSELARTVAEALTVGVPPKLVRKWIDDEAVPPEVLHLLDEAEGKSG